MVLGWTEDITECERTRCLGPIEYPGLISSLYGPSLMAPHIPPTKQTTDVIPHFNLRPP